jgi:hypothetical protein
MCNYIFEVLKYIDWKAVSVEDLSQEFIDEFSEYLYNNDGSPYEKYATCSCTACGSNNNVEIHWKTFRCVSCAHISKVWLD